MKEISDDVAWAIELKKGINQEKRLKAVFRSEVNQHFLEKINDLRNDYLSDATDPSDPDEYLARLRTLINERDRCLDVWK